MLPYKLFIIETAFYRINPFSLPNFKTYNLQDRLHSIIYRSTIIVDTPLVYRRLVRYFSFCERLHSKQTADLGSDTQEAAGTAALLLSAEGAETAAGAADTAAADCEQ